MRRNRQAKDYNVQVNITNGIAAAVGMNLVNPYFAKFIERMGATDYEMALLNSLPALVSVFAFLPGAILIEATQDKVKSTSIILMVQKCFYLLMAMVPFLSGPYKPLLFVILVGLMNFPGSIGSIGYQSCIGDVFQPHQRGVAMALRNRFSEGSKLVVTLIAGQLLSVLPKTNAQSLMLYQVFFVFAFIIGVSESITMLKFTRIRKTATRGAVKEYIQKFKGAFLSIPEHKAFLTFMICSLIFHFSWQMGWPLMNIVMIKTLKATEGWVSAISIAAGAGTILTSTLWAKFINKRGNNLMLAIATSGMAITPILYAFSTSLFQIFLFNVITGIAIAGTILTLFNMLLEVTPNENRTIYIAIYNIFINISATIAPIISVWLSDLTSITFALIVIGLLRFVGSGAFFLRCKTRNAWSNFHDF